MKKATAIFLLLTTLLGLWGAARLHEHLWNYRARHQLLPPAPLENAPPLMAFTTVALGGFRGLIADLLWIRTIHLQEEGRIFEIVQLADWITKLEPHFTTVWAFQAWNMAYNISVLFPDAENRWRWISNGIRLLRDEGLRYNPRNPILYKELGWLYQHKIGYIMDAAHHFYRRQLAATMSAALHGTQPAINPQGTDPRSTMVPTNSDTLQYLREELKLDPIIMRQLDAEYGPFDWRLPETHALYWAWRGYRAAWDNSGETGPATAAGAGQHPAPGQATLSNARASAAAQPCGQMMLQCLAAAFRQGRLDFDPATDLYVTTPRLDLLPKIMQTYDTFITCYEVPLFRTVYANFMGEAIFILHCYGLDQQARAIHQQTLRQHPDFDQTVGYDDFIRANFASIQTNAIDLAPPDAVAVIEGLLFQACQQKAAGDSANAAKNERQASLFWDSYMQARVSEDHRRRTGLPKLDILRRQAERRMREEAAAAARSAPANTVESKAMPP